MPCQYAATACCAAAVIFGVSLPLLSLRLMLLRILLMMGMLECLLCFPEEPSLRGCAASPASKQDLFQLVRDHSSIVIQHGNQQHADSHADTSSASPNDRRCTCCSTGLGTGRSAGRDLYATCGSLACDDRTTGSRHQQQACQIWHQSSAVLCKLR